MSKVGLIVQARLTSKRFPKKIIQRINEFRLIDHLIYRLEKTLYPIIIAVPANEFSFFENYMQKEFKNCIIFGGSENNVLSRYYFAAKKYQIKTIIRVTSDNPLTSITCMQDNLKTYRKNNFDIVYMPNIPYGAGVEIIRYEALKKVFHEAKTNEDTEHVTPFFYKNKNVFKHGISSTNPIYNFKLRVTIDTQNDLNRYKYWVNQIGLTQNYLSLKQVIAFEKKHLYKSQ